MSAAQSHGQRIEEARKCLHAAALLAEGYGKPETAAKFRAASDAILPPDECDRLGHNTTEMLWPGTAHQGVVCHRCGSWLPC